MAQPLSSPSYQISNAFFATAFGFPFSAKVECHVRQRGRRRVCRQLRKATWRAQFSISCLLHMRVRTHVYLFFGAAFSIVQRSCCPAVCIFCVISSNVGKVGVLAGASLNSSLRGLLLQPAPCGQFGSCLCAELLRPPRRPRPPQLPTRGIPTRIASQRSPPHAASDQCAPSRTCSVIYALVVVW